MMSTSRAIFFLFITAWIVSACATESPEPDNILKMRPLTYEEQALLNSSNEFSFNLLRMLDAKEPEKNTIFSSFGVGNGIGMAFNIIESRPKQELKEFLNISEVRDIEIHRAYFQLGEILNLIDRDIQFTKANSLWINHNEEINPLSGDKIMAYYDADLNFLNFKNQRSVKRINNWIENRSYGKIPEIIHQVYPGDKSYIINAIHFDAKWNTPLLENMPEQYQFTTPDGNTTTCSRINAYSGKVNSFTDNELTIYDIPLGKEQFYLTMIIPANVYSLHKLIGKLNAEKIENYLDKTSGTDLEIYFPELDFNKEVRLRSLFPQFGLSGPLSVIENYYPVSQLFISDFIHKTRFNISSNYQTDLQGQVQGQESADPGKEIKLIDRPFIFLVREKYTGSIVFTGKMVNPEE